MTKLAKTLTEAKWFRAVIMAVILLAGVLAGLETSAALLASYGGLFQALDVAVLCVFIVEITLKMVAHGRRPLDFFRDGWNVFDFVIVALCLVPSTGSFGAVLRLARVLRLLRLVTALPKLQLLVGALLKSLSAMGYVSLLLSLLFYIYAVAGVHMFGQSDEDFGTIGTALLTLFRIVTLDDWGNIYNRAAEHAPMIKVSIYFVTFIVLGTMIILNLFIGVILNSMSETHAEIEQGDHSRGGHTLDDELGDLERQLKSLQENVQRLRRGGGKGVISHFKGGP
jgi:voltage-gated sodium channel